MGDKLGIFVSSDKHIEHLIGITKAAGRAGKQVTVFLTNRGVLLPHDPRFVEMEGLCEISLCSLCLEAFKVPRPVPVVKERNFATQARNVQMIEDCDRYIVL